MAAVTAAPPGTAPVLAALRMLGNETAKGVRVMWTHKAVLVMQLAVMTGTYFAVQLFVGGGRLEFGLVRQTSFAYLAYVVGYVALLRMASGVLEEMYTGTLEQSLLSPLRPWVLSLGRLASSLVEGLLTTAVVIALFLALPGLDLGLRWELVVPVALTLADIAGFALLIGGVALVVNSIGAVVHVIQSLILLLNGAIVPVYLFPTWLEVSAKLAPTTLGVDVTRRISYSGESLADTWADHSLPLAALHAAVLLALGWWVYQAAVDRGLRDGRLGP